MYLLPSAQFLQTIIVVVQFHLVYANSFHDFKDPYSYYFLKPKVLCAPSEVVIHSQQLNIGQQM
jgi:hypothetical protein